MLAEDPVFKRGYWVLGIGYKLRVVPLKAGLRVMRFKL